METRPMTVMEERLMTRFMQANRERDNALQAIMDVFTPSGDGATSYVQDTLPTACATHTVSVDTAHRRGV